MIHTEGVKEEKDPICLGRREQVEWKDGVVGSSEWTWLEPVNAELICKAVNTYDDVLALSQGLLDLVEAATEWGMHQNGSYTLCNKLCALAATILGHKPPPKVIGGPQL